MNKPADSASSRLKLPAALESLEPFQDFVSAQIRNNACSKDAQFKIQLALEEILVNIAHYAYPGGDVGWIELLCRLEQDGKRLCVEIRDAGRAFNPLSRGQPNTEVSLEKREIGGLGIFLVRQMTTKAEYRREDDTNVLTLEFDL